MIRTQIQLTERQFTTLKRMAEEENTSMAGLIRRAIDQSFRSPSGVSKKERKARAMAVTGRFHSGQDDLSERHDDAFAEACLP